MPNHTSRATRNGLTATTGGAFGLDSAVPHFIAPGTVTLSALASTGAYTSLVVNDAKLIQFGDTGRYRLVVTGTASYATAAAVSDNSALTVTVPNLTFATTSVISGTASVIKANGSSFVHNVANQGVGSNGLTTFALTFAGSGAFNSTTPTTGCLVSIDMYIAL